MTVTRANFQPSSTKAPTLSGELGDLLNRLVNRWVAGVIARSEREAARAALPQLDDRKLKDIGIHQLGDAFAEIARERQRLQRRRQSG